MSEYGLNQALGEKQSDDAGSRSKRRSVAAENALRAFIRECYRDRFGHVVDDRALDLNLKIRAFPGRNWGLEFEPSLSEQILPQIERIEAARDVFKQGRVYCFRCRESECVHGLPDSPLDVFCGYDPLGSPQWKELTQALLDLRDERVDGLFGRQPKILARFIKGRELHARQLGPFGKSSKTYALIGQVIAGYFKLKRDHQDTARMAVTIQAVEVTDRRGRIGLQLNTVCKAPSGVILGEDDSEAYGWLKQVQERSKKALTKIEKNLASAKKNGGEAAFETKICDLMRKLGRDLERGQRRSERRTQHAKDRDQMARPVHKAMSDLMKSRPDQVFFDEKTKGVILWGNKGRCHVFSERGRHVTSFVIHAKAVQTRLRKKRWRSLEPDRYSRFMERFRNHPPEIMWP